MFLAGAPLCRTLVAPNDLPLVLHSPMSVKQCLCYTFLDGLLRQLRPLDTALVPYTGSASDILDLGVRHVQSGVFSLLGECRIRVRADVSKHVAIRNIGPDCLLLSSVRSRGTVVKECFECECTLDCLAVPVKMASDCSLTCATEGHADNLIFFSRRESTLR